MTKNRSHKRPKVAIKYISPGDINLPLKLKAGLLLRQKEIGPYRFWGVLTLPKLILSQQTHRELPSSYNQMLASHLDSAFVWNVNLNSLSQASSPWDRAIGVRPTY